MKLQRHVGPIGLLFAAIGSIIGSGWLFGAFNASAIAGPAAVFSWLIAGGMVILIGLCYAELGTMFPFSGGVVRYPHFVWGSFASYTLGWINWIASAAVTAIEVEGALTYGTKYVHSPCSRKMAPHRCPFVLTRRLIIRAQWAGTGLRICRSGSERRSPPSPRWIVRL